MSVVNIQIWLDCVWKNVTMSNSELDVIGLGIVGCRDNNAPVGFPEWENIITAGDTEKPTLFSV